MKEKEAFSSVSPLCIQRHSEWIELVKEVYHCIQVAEAVSASLLLLLLLLLLSLSARHPLVSRLSWPDVCFTSSHCLFLLIAFASPTERVGRERQSHRGWVTCWMPMLLFLFLAFTLPWQVTPSRSSLSHENVLLLMSLWNGEFNTK